MKRPKRKQKSGNRATGTALKRMEAVKSPSEPPAAPTFYLCSKGGKRLRQPFFKLKLANIRLFELKPLAREGGKCYTVIRKALYEC